MQIIRIKRDLNIVVAMLLLLVGVLYVYNTWSSSSYEIALEQFGVKNTGLVIWKA